MILEGLFFWIEKFCQRIWHHFNYPDFKFNSIFRIYSSSNYFLVQAMYVGFSNLDFTLNRYFSINGSVDFIRKNLGFSLGNGVAFMLIIMIPVVGLFFAPTLGAAAATLKAVPRIYRPSFT